MQRNTTSLALESSVGQAPAFGVSWAKVASHDSLLLYLSLLILLFSTTDDGPVGDTIKVCWLISFFFLTLVNMGGAFASYIASLAIYSPLHFETTASLLQRPDNLATPILFAVMACQIFYQKRPLRSVNGYMAAFFAFFLVHGLLFAHDQATLFRNAIPYLACIFVAWLGFRERESEVFLDGLIALGCYNGFVSILERTPFYDRVLPLWIGNPALRPYDLYENQWAEYARSGGTLIQPALNGLLLGMVLMILMLRMRKGVTAYYAIAVSLCLAGVFFTYTRGAWLALLIALLWFPGWCRTPKQATVRRVAMVVVAAVFLAVAGGAARDRLEDSNNILFRFNLWGAAVRLVARHPVLGVGFFNFGWAMTGVQQGFGILQPKFRQVEAGIASHNTALTVLVEFGLPGLVLFLTAFVKLIQQGRVNCRRFLGVAASSWFIAFTLIYIVNAQFISCFEVTVNTIFFGVLAVFAGAQESPA